MLSDLPRTIKLERAGEGDGLVPQGFPVLTIIDQTKLPQELVYISMTDWREVIRSIKELRVRGAPAIGIAGAAALVLRAAEYVYAHEDDARSDAQDFDRVFIIDEDAFDPELYEMGMSYAARMISAARPTAINLVHEVSTTLHIMEEELATGSMPVIIEAVLFEHVQALIDADESANRTMGIIGASLLPQDCRILTHCNAGSLATSFFGTALGVAYTAFDQGKLKRVIADETRPVCQGSRLTVWELAHAGVPVTLICDDMAAYVMQQGMIDAVVVGADRIASNGDVVNKIGTLGVAILADSFNIPFYVVAPTSTIDMTVSCGLEIPIEQRNVCEVLPDPIEGVDVLNPAFDVTPASLVTKIITEQGAFDPADILLSIPDQA